LVKESYQRRRIRVYNTIIIRAFAPRHSLLSPPLIHIRIRKWRPLLSPPPNTDEKQTAGQKLKKESKAAARAFFPFPSSVKPPAHERRAGFAFLLLLLLPSLLTRIGQGPRGHPPIPLLAPLLLLLLLLCAERPEGEYDALRSPAQAGFPCFDMVLVAWGWW
jgi:hypothetical protein